MDQKRPYLGLNDAVRVIKYIVSNDIFDGEIYNIVSSNNTVRDIINAIQESIPKLNVELVKSEIMNQLSYEVLPDKIEKCGFTTSDSHITGIKETIALISNK